MKTFLNAKRLQLHQTPLILHIGRETGGKIGRAVLRGGSLTVVYRQRAERPSRTVGRSWRLDSESGAEAEKANDQGQVGP